jgi:hypothetical protein
MGFWREKLFGTPRKKSELKDYLRNPVEVDPQDRLFIAHREQFVGIIQSAETKTSRVSGLPYTVLGISYDGIDTTYAILSRLMYTNYVLKFGLRQDYDAQAFNIARLVGGTAKIRFDHKVHVNDQVYPTAIILEILP